MESCAAQIKDLGLPAIEEAQLLYEQKQLEERSLAIRLNHIRQGPLEAIRRLTLPSRGTCDLPPDTDGATTLLQPEGDRLG